MFDTFARQLVFSMSFNLQEECQLLQQDVLNYPISRDHDVQNMDQVAAVELLEGTLVTCLTFYTISQGDLHIKGAVETVSQSSDAIIVEEIFDIYRSLLKYVRYSPCLGVKDRFNVFLGD